MTTQYTGTLNAYITSPYTSLETLAKSDEPVGELSYSALDMKGYDSWTKVGTAVITVTLDSEEKIVADLVESIDAQIQNTYAEAELKIQQLKEKKEKLLALTWNQS